MPTEGIDVFGIHFSFPSIKETLFPTPAKYANIDDLVAEEQDDDSKHEYEIAKVKIGDRYISGLEYPNEDTTLLYSFFSGDGKKILTPNLAARDCFSCFVSELCKSSS